MANNQLCHFGAAIAVSNQYNLKSNRFNRLVVECHDKLINDCTAYDIGQAIANSSDGMSADLEKCFSKARSSEFYQVVLSLVYDEFREQAIDMATEIVEYE